MFDFSNIQPQERQLVVGTSKFVVRECSEGAACEWRNAAMKAARFQDGKVASINGAADNEPLLVSLCTFPVNEAGAVSDKHVHVDVVRGWPSRVVRPVFDWLREVSQLEEKEDMETLTKRLADTQKKIDALVRKEDEAKNSQPASTATSD